MTLHKKVANFIAGTSAVVLMLAVVSLFLLSIPLSVISLVRWFEWEWWSALIVIVVIQAIPGLGQLATIATTLAGAFYLIMADFNWSRATQPELSEMEAGWAEIMEEHRPRAIEQCIEDDALFDFSGVRGEDFPAFCECVTKSMAQASTPEEFLYAVQHGGVSPEFQKSYYRAIASCR